MPKFYFELLDRLKIGIILLDNNYKIVFWNNWMQKKTDLPIEKVINKEIYNISPKFNLPKYSEILSSVFNSNQSRFLSGAVHGTFFSNFENQSSFQVKQNIQIEKIDDNTLLIQVEDQTGNHQKVQKMKKFIEHLEKENDEIKQTEEKTRQIALHDMLTGLPNRLYFIEKLQSILNDKKNNPSSSTIAVFFIDLDDLKFINDKYGHKTGDLVLKEFANRLLYSACDSSSVARLAGDEFIIVCSSCNGNDDYDKLANHIIENIKVPFEIIPGESYDISASIGISIYPTDGITVEDLIDKADKALYKVKDSGKNSYAFYSSI